MATQTPTVLRYATQEDVTEILAMIRELAIFEKAEHEVLATEEKLINTLTFEPSATTPIPTPGYAKTLLATIPAASSESGKEEIAGMGLYFYNYSTWQAAPGIYLEDLFVRDQYRRRGIASMLLKELAKEARKLSGDGSRFQWSCLRWNQRALDFYKGVGGEQQDEWIGIRVDGQNLKKLAD